MTKTQLKSLAFLIVFTLGTATLVWLAYDKHKIEAEEGRVYLSIFDPDPNKLEFQNIIAFSQPSDCQSNESDYKGLPPELVNNFIEANKKDVGPVRLSVLEGKVPIVSWEDTKRIYEKSTASFFRPEEQRLLRLSRVGFNSKMTEALACIEISENSFGYAVLIFLKKTAKKWNVIEKQRIWVS